MRRGQSNQWRQQPSAPLPVETMLDRSRESIRNRLLRSLELSSQGKWAEAGKELDAIEVEVRK